MEIGGVGKEAGMGRPGGQETENSQKGVMSLFGLSRSGSRVQAKFSLIAEGQRAAVDIWVT